MSFHPLWPATWPHPHAIFEPLAYLVGALVYRASRRPDPVGDAFVRMTITVAAVLGAAVGSKLLFWLEAPLDTWSHRFDPVYLMGGKTIVGGLLGGWLAVEVCKRWLGVTVSTGDRFVRPLAAGMVVGRVGCFLAGVEDGTHGTVTSLPWGMDLGDGALRHPTALYEIVVVGLLGLLARGPFEGDRFRAFLGGYLLWRLAVEALKTQPALLLGLSAIQIACVGGLVLLTLDRTRVLRLRTMETAP